MTIVSYKTDLENLFELQKQLAYVRERRAEIAKDKTGRALAFVNQTDNSEMRKNMMAAECFAMVAPLNGNAEPHFQSIHAFVAEDDTKAIMEMKSSGYTLVGKLNNRYTDILGHAYSDGDLGAFHMLTTLGRQCAGLPDVNAEQQEEAEAKWKVLPKRSLNQDKAALLTLLENMEEIIQTDIEEIPADIRANELLARHKLPLLVKETARPAEQGGYMAGNRQQFKPPEHNLN